MTQFMQHEREKDIGFIIQTRSVLVVDSSIRRIKAGIVFDYADANVLMFLLIQVLKTHAIKKYMASVKTGIQKEPAMAGPERENKISLK